MKEIVVKIGKEPALTTIFSAPKNLDTNKPAVLIFNSGVMHHIGTCRISVTIARKLARSGILAARFDFSGIGDSTTRRGNLPFEQSSVEEIRQVMDYLEQKKGIRKFIVYGLCSGADAAYEIAKVEPRICGIIQIDAYCYRTPKWYIKHYGPRLINPGVWKRILLRLVGKANHTRSEGENIDDEYLEMPSYIRVFPPRNEVAKGLQQIIDNDVSIYSIFTGGMMYTMNYHGQFEDAFRDVDFKGRLKAEWYPELDHILTHVELQKKLPEYICRWVQENSDPTSQAT